MNSIFKLNLIKTDEFLSDYVINASIVFLRFNYLYYTWKTFLSETVRAENYCDADN